MNVRLGELSKPQDMQIHKIGIIGIFTAALIGCRREIMPEVSEKVPVTFKTSMAQSRAVPLTEASLEKFYVSAAYTPGNFNYTTSPNHNFALNLLVSQSADGTWGPSAAETLYWPSTGKLSFFAYSDNTDTRIEPNSAIGYPRLTYTQATDVVQTKDFLLATPVMNRSRQTDAVTLQFHHTMAAISFALKLVDNATPITVDRIELRKLRNEATFQLNDFGYTRTGIGSSTADYTFSRGTELKNESFNTPGPNDLTGRASRLYVVPQETNNEMVIEVTYNGSSTAQTLQLKSYLPRFESGKHYRLVLTYYGENTTHATLGLTVEVADWEDGGDTDIYYGSNN